MQIRVTLSGTTWAPGALPGFTIDPSGGYVSSGKPGTVNASARDVVFIGGNYDGWRGAINSDPSNFYIRFGKTPSDPRVGDTTSSGDFQCFRQK